MRKHLLASLWLLGSTLVLCSVAYPAALLLIGRPAFPFQAEGSLIRDPQGQVVGSRLIAQPFTRDEYFWPRPSAGSYNAAASAASNWGASSYLLRDRVARSLGAVVKYSTGPRNGQAVARDIEDWFHTDTYQGQPGIVAQWAKLHPTLAQNWVKADQRNEEFVAAWQRAHPAEVASWIRDNPSIAEPRPTDLAVPFFVSFSAHFPGTFLALVERTTPDGKSEQRLEPVRAGEDIQAVFFDMWRQEHPDVALQHVSGDAVMASGSGLDPHITLNNALSQLDRVAAKWAEMTRRDRAQVRSEIEALLREKSAAPLGGLAGVDLVNVLEVNLALQNRYSP